MGEAYDADWVVKMDDDVFLAPQRLLAAASQWDRMGAGTEAGFNAARNASQPTLPTPARPMQLAGMLPAVRGRMAGASPARSELLASCRPPSRCRPAPSSAGYVGCMKHGVTWTQPGTRWFEPAHLLIGATYYLHAYGSIYALSGRVVQEVVVANFGHLRMLSNEDTSVGAWMLGHQVCDDARLSELLAASLVGRATTTAASVLPGQLNASCCGCWATATGSVLRQLAWRSALSHPPTRRPPAQVRHFEDMRLCSPRCSLAAVAVLRNECAGLCHPVEDMYALHANLTCRAAAPAPLPYARSHPEHRQFEQMWV